MFGRGGISKRNHNDTCVDPAGWLARCLYLWWQRSTARCAACWWCVGAHHHRCQRSGTDDPPMCRASVLGSPPGLHGLHSSTSVASDRHCCSRRHWARYRRADQHLQAFCVSREPWPMVKPSHSSVSSAVEITSHHHDHRPLRWTRAGEYPLRVGHRVEPAYTINKELGSVSVATTCPPVAEPACALTVCAPAVGTQIFCACTVTPTPAAPWA